MMIIINKDQQSQLKIGTNKILYDPKVNDEFKFWYFDNELTSTNPYQDPYVPQAEISVDVQVADSIYGSDNFAYGSGNDICQQTDPNSYGW